MSDLPPAPEQPKGSERLAAQGSRSVRKSKNPTANESLIIALLREAVSQLPMQQNMSIISACMRVPSNVSKLDTALMKAIRDLSHSFIIARAYQKEAWVTWVVPFKIYSGDYQKYVEPWAKDIEVSWINDGISDYPKRFNRPLTDEEHLFIYSRWISKYSFDNLEIAFAGWSCAICNRFAATVAELLSPASNALLARVLAGMNSTTGVTK